MAVKKPFRQRAADLTALDQVATDQWPDPLSVELFWPPVLVPPLVELLLCPCRECFLWCAVWVVLPLVPELLPELPALWPLMPALPLVMRELLLCPAMPLLPLMPEVPLFMLPELLPWPLMLPLVWPVRWLPVLPLVLWPALCAQAPPAMASAIAPARLAHFIKVFMMFSCRGCNQTPAWSVVMTDRAVSLRHPGDVETGSLATASSHAGVCLTRLFDRIRRLGECSARSVQQA